MKRWISPIVFDNLAASLIGNMIGRLTEKVPLGKGTLRTGENFWWRFIFWLVLKFKDIIKINSDLDVFIQEKIRK